MTESIERQEGAENAEAEVRNVYLDNGTEQGRTVGSQQIVFNRQQVFTLKVFALNGRWAYYREGVQILQNTLLRDHETRTRCLHSTSRAQDDSALCTCLMHSHAAAGLML